MLFPGLDYCKQTHNIYQQDINFGKVLCPSIFFRSISLSFPHSLGWQCDSTGQSTISGSLLKTSRGNSASQYRYYIGIVSSFFFLSFSFPLPSRFSCLPDYQVCNVDGMSQGRVAIFAASGCKITPGRAEEEGGSSTPDVAASFLTCPPLAVRFIRRTMPSGSNYTSCQVSLTCNQMHLVC